MENNLYRIYLQSLVKMHKAPGIILQADQADQDAQDDAIEQEGADDVEAEAEADEETEADESDAQNDDTDAEADQNKNQVDLRFSADLASQFGNTVNMFTEVAANVIKKRSVNKDDSDKIFNLMGKIKDLLDAAKKST